MNSSAAGLSTRFFKERTPIGPLTIGNSTANFLMNGCLAGNVNMDWENCQIAVRSEQIDSHFEGSRDHRCAEIWQFLCVENISVTPDEATLDVDHSPWGARRTVRPSMGMAGNT